VDRPSWRPSDWAWLGAGLALATILRLLLWPAQGLRDDIDQFVGWVHHITISGLGTLYGETAAGPVTFGPVMGYVWTLLSAVDPAFATATDGSAEGIRILMKVPATIADYGIAALIAYALRERPRWAALAALGYLLHPAAIYTGAWWGQYESVYALGVLAATVLAVSGRTGLAAAALTVAVLTKPQALPLVVPLAAWFWATGGWRELARAAVIGLGVAVVIWLPFIVAGGPLGYLSNIAYYQGGVFAILSLRAWNAWWIVQELAAGGSFVLDASPLLGPITFRHVGYLLTAVVEVGVANAVIRDPRPRTLYLALAASVLVAFSFLTTMHERYAFAAIVFLGLLIHEPRIRALAIAFGTVFLLNLVAAVSPLPSRAGILPVGGAIGIAGSVAILAITAAVLFYLSPRARDAPT
jgi:dolichyl-phosphate-mannose-protein mannosyltransferase